MKELSIEEKAKAYDEALEIARKINSGEGVATPSDWTICETIFPELKESEDEKIRKWLITQLELKSDVNNPHDLELMILKSIAWLEKQGEQNYKIIKGKNYFCVKTHNYAGVKWIEGTKYYASDNYTLVNQGCEYYCPEYSKEEHNNLFEEVKYDGCVEKQGETTSTDDFGEFINILSKQFPEVSFAKLSRIAVRVKKWLEKQGAERKQLYVRFGDIPSNEKSKIYRGEEEIGEENGVSVYPAFELNGNIVLGLTLPITRTTLYTQQHLLEYDNRPCYLVSGDYVGSGTDGEPLIRNISIIKRLDNYRIKEIEKQGEHTCLLDNSESNVKFPFKAKVKSNGKIVTIQGGQLSMDCKKYVKYQSNVEDGYMVYEPENLELVCNVEQKSAEWSKEDMDIINGIIMDYEGEIEHLSDSAIDEQAKPIYQERINFLNRLKSLYPVKQEWSEVDEKNLEDAIWYVEKGGKLIFAKTDKLVSWLKSLRLHKHWKPSESDILLLERIANGKSNPQDFQASLCCLIEQLKKLREE